MEKTDLLVYKMGLTLIPGIGDITGKKLVSYCGGVEAVFREKRHILMKIPGIGKATVDAIVNQKIFGRAEEEVKFIDQYQVKALFYLDKEYPERLKQCVDGPIMIYYKGNADLNAPRILSIVGSRRATSYGKDMVEFVISGFTGESLLIVSGLAYGIDTCSHKAALSNGFMTVGVMAHGLDMIYPYLNKPLAGQMVKNGGLLTEFISGSNPDRENFPKRNRIIAGLADAVVIVESGIKGGALITADIASSYDRDVFAIPGRLTDPLSDGCNHLIKTNRAALIQSAEDIKYFMSWEKHDPAPVQQKLDLFELDENQKVVIELLKVNKEASIDFLCAQSKINTGILSKALLSLEFEGIIKSLPGKIYRLIRTF